MTVRIFDGRTRTDAIPAGNRGVAYGDGLFETMRAYRGELPWWDAHWERLRHGAQRLHMPLPEHSQARDEAAALLDDDGGGVVKLLVSRGGDARGYAPSRTADPLWMLSRHPTPSPPAQAGLRLRWCQTRLASQPLLAGIKHCNRLEQVLARGECVDAGADDGLLLDDDGFAISATAANLFALRDGGWITPLLDRCGVAGVCRSRLMPLLDAREARLSIADVEGADAVFLCNAVRGILVVAQLGAHAWPRHPAVEDARQKLARIHPAFLPHLDHS